MTDPVDFEKQVQEWILFALDGPDAIETKAVPSFVFRAVYDYELPYFHEHPDEAKHELVGSISVWTIFDGQIIKSSNFAALDHWTDQDRVSQTVHDSWSAVLKARQDLIEEALADR